MSEHHELGKMGEVEAAHFLQAKGYRILATNWRFKNDEIDLIALDKDTLVVVEVKTRSSAYYGAPFEAVTKKKQAFLIRAANAYIEQNNIDMECRFDVISIVFRNNMPELDHIVDAFYPT